MFRFGWRRSRQARPPDHWSAVPLADLPDLVGMTFPDELRYLYWWCATRYRGRGRVVELGPFLGRTTAPMAAGLRRSAHPNARVFSIDSHIWNEWGLGAYGAIACRDLTPAQRRTLPPRVLNPVDGDSFRPLFDIYTRPYRDNIEALSADLDTYSWGGEPIEFLFVDAAKSWKTLDQILQQYFTCLVDDATVVHQDYKHFFTYWLHPVTERMMERGVLELADNISGTPSQAFRFRRRPNFDVRDYFQNTFTEAECLSRIGASVQRFPASDAIAVRGAQCHYSRQIGQPGRAHHYFSEAIQKGGYCDNYGLWDLLTIAAEWHVPLGDVYVSTSVFSNPPSGSAKLEKSGPTSVRFPCGAAAQPTRFRVPGLETGGCSQLVMQLSAEAAVRVRVKLLADENGAVVFDAVYALDANRSESVVAPLQHPRVTLECEAQSADGSSGGTFVTCLAPLLIRAVDGV